jgi:hypothetical protein
VAVGKAKIRICQQKIMANHVVSSVMFSCQEMIGWGKVTFFIYSRTTFFVCSLTSCSEGHLSFSPITKNITPEIPLP